MTTTLTITLLTLIWLTLALNKNKPKHPPHQCNCPYCEYKNQHIKP